MYLTYEDYTTLGGTLDEVTYTKYEMKAESIVDWYTFNRLKKETEYPPEVGRCMYMLIDLLLSEDIALGGSPDGSSSAASPAQIASQSNDGVSVSYSIMSTTELIKYRQKEIDDIVKRSLQGVMNTLGHKLLYRGLYPGE